MAIVTVIPTNETSPVRAQNALSYAHALVHVCINEYVVIHDLWDEKDEDATNLHNRATTEVARVMEIRTGMRAFVSQPTREYFWVVVVCLCVPASTWSS